MARISVKNDSGDKEFFTIVPNYVINHSNALDRALYLEMKRFAGEDGQCFATEKTMMKRLKIGKKAFDKSLSYLISRGWVDFMGLTGGKTRPIKTYKINNIWRENSDYYKKISAGSTLSNNEEISAESEGDKSPKQHKISAESNVEEEPTLRRSIKKNTTSEQSSQDIPKVIKLFETVNPLIGKYYANKTQRASVTRLLKVFGFIELERMIAFLPRTNAMPYAPKITTPYQFEQDYAKLKAFLAQKRSINKVAQIR